MDIKKIMSIHYLINSGQAKTPANMAKRLDVSERTVYLILNFMKSELDVPIKYDKIKMRYYYSKSGKLNLKWQEDDLNIIK